MARTLTAAERENFLAQPNISVLSMTSDDDRPPLTVPIYYAVTAESTVVKLDWEPTVADVVAIAGRDLSAGAAHGSAEAEIGNPAGTFVLFTARPDHWLSFDCATINGARANPDQIRRASFSRRRHWRSR
ncbi:MAG: hypothetical protein ACRDTT_36245 [Pseudonocardiaceae bacterium]